MNIHEMLRPHGQLFFNAIAKVPQDEAFYNLDQGRWRNYENCKSFSPFYGNADPMKCCEKLLEDIGFVDCHLYQESFTTLHTEEQCRGKYILNTCLLVTLVRIVTPLLKTRSPKSTN